MSFGNQYLDRVYAGLAQRNSDQPEYLQAVEEVLESIKPAVIKHPEYEEAGLIERLVEPERTIMFRVSWIDDAGKVRVNRGYRIEFNSAIGPYKGGLRFHSSVNLSILKFLGFEQTFKNALTGLPMGGGKGGSDFDPKGCSDREIMRFCQSFMTELYRHIGPDRDVPAGDIGVGGREIGYLYGQYKRIANSHDSVLTGKGLAYGGSLLRPEATGYGAIYYIEELLRSQGEQLRGKTFALSGYGNVTWGAAKKINELGGKVLTISGHQGYVRCPEGLTDEQVGYLLAMRADPAGSIRDFAAKYAAEYHEGEKPWGVKCDICLPCATQNEVGLADARQIAANGTKYYAEASNMSSTREAAEYLKANGVIFAPSKAVNAGGVAVSGLEMSQNHQHLSWSAEEVDRQLRRIMKDIFNESRAAAQEYGLGGDLAAGANLAGFRKVAAAMLAQGITA